MKLAGIMHEEVVREFLEANEKLNLLVYNVSGSIRGYLLV